MRHEHIRERGSHFVELASLWPVGATAAPFPIAEAGAASEARDFASASSAPDVPGAVGMMIACAYAALIAAFALASAGSANSVVMILVAFLLVIAFGTIPRLSLPVEPQAGR